MARTIAAGYEGLRVTGDTACMPKELHATFAAYEQQANGQLGRFPLLTLCTYPLDTCSGAAMLDVIQAHQYALVPRDGRWEVLHTATSVPLRDTLQYQTLFANMDEAVVYAELISNDDGQPIDYRFLEVNAAYERLTGLTATQVLGKRASEAYAAVQPLFAQYFALIAHAVTTGTMQRGEFYSEYTGQTFLTSAIPLGDSHLITISADITALVQSQQAVQQQLHLMETLADALPTPLFFKGLDGTYSGCNKAFETLVGMTEEEIIGKTVFDISPLQAHAAQFHTMDEQLRRQPGVQQYEASYTSHDGRYHDLLYTKTTFCNPDGTAAGLVGVILDITERKQMEDALRESENKYRSIVECLPGVFWIVRPGDLSLLYISDHVEAVLGYTREHFMSQQVRLEQLLHPDDAATILDELAKLDATEHYTLREARYRHRDGRYIWIASTVKLLVDDAGNPAYLQGIALDITAQKEAEAVLRESEHKYRMLVECFPGMIWMTNSDPNYTPLYLSDAVEEIFGYPKEDFLEGRLRFTDIVFPEDLERVNSAVEEALAEHKPYQIELRFRKQDGSVAWTLEVGQGVFDDAGELRFLEGITLDITERKHAEAALRDSEEKYRALTENSTDIILRFDRDCRVIYTNPAIAQVTDTPAAEIIGKHPSEGTMPAEITTRIAAEVARVFASGETVRTEVELLAMDRSLVFDWRLFPEFAADGSVHTVITAATDITMSKEAKEKIRRMNQRLEQRVQQRTRELAATNAQLQSVVQALDAERAHLAAAFDVLPVPLYFVSPAHKVIRRNMAYLHFLDQYDMREQAVPMLDPRTRAIIPRELRPVSSALNGHTLPPTESLFALPDGRDVPIIASAAPVYVGDKLVAGAVAFQDITFLKEAERAKDQFLATITHELLTPLTSILGWAQMARLADNASMTARALEVIERNAVRQKRVVDDLLDLSRLAHGKLSLRVERTDLCQLVQQNVENITHRVQERQLTLDCTCTADPLYALVDPERIAQVLGNLLHNAVKFTEVGGTIALSLSTEGESTILRVQDNGCGMQPEDLAHLFTPFQQATSTAVNSDGLGVGLALVKGIVELHGGRVEADSPGPGLGSTFTVTLPL